MKQTTIEMLKRSLTKGEIAQIFTKKEVVIDESFRERKYEEYVAHMKEIRLIENKSEK